MSDKTFVAVVGTIIAVLLGSMLVQKYEDCAKLGGKACPRLGRASWTGSYERPARR
jgi:hypothetical protein